jgi:hypothetical protein
LVILHDGDGGEEDEDAEMIDIQARKSNLAFIFDYFFCYYSSTP